MQKWTKIFFSMALVMFIIISALFLLTRGSGSTTELFLWRLGTPVTKIVGKMNNSTSAIGAFFTSTQSLHNIIIDLRKQVSEQDLVRAQNKNLESINLTLREQLNLPPHDILNKSTFVTGDVIGYNPGRTRTWLVINRGSNDGVEVGMTALSRHYGIFVGTVMSVDSKSAHIILPTNTKSVLRTKTAAHGTRGVTRGTSGISARITLVDRTQPLIDNDYIMTVRDGSIPENLLVGTMQGIRISDDTLFQEAIIVPAYTPSLNDSIVIHLSQ